MPRNMKRFKQCLQKITCHQQKELDTPATAPSAEITLEDSASTSTRNVQQEQSRDSFPFTSPTNPQQPPAALWDRAYDALAKEMPNLVEDYDKMLANESRASSAPDETTTIQVSAPHGIDTRPDCSRRQVQLVAVIQKRLQQMEDDKTTYMVFGNELVPTYHITQVSNYLQWGKDWMCSAVKESPEASLAWSAVCIILPLLMDSTTAAEANWDGFVYVTSRLRYYAELEPTLRRLGQNDSVDEALMSAVNDHVVDLYQAILEFQLSSARRFHQSCFGYSYGAREPVDWEQILLRIMKREDTANNALGQINDLAANERLVFLNNTSEDTRDAMETHLSVAPQQLNVLKEQLAALEDADQKSLLVEHWEKQRKCLQTLWLAQNRNGRAYNWYKDRVEPRVEGTCKWFLQHENFQKWLLQESGPLLVSADPGCGKSVLAKYLIDHELAKQSATICYFFFKEQDQNTIRQALCALLHQLFTKNRPLIQHAMELYNDIGAGLAQSEKLLWTILRDTVRDPDTEPVIFVIDALDECDRQELSSLISNLEDMFCGQQPANAKLKVLMTSRPYEQVVGEYYNLRDYFPRSHILGEEEFEVISREISIVIHHRVEQLAEKHRLSDKIKSSLEKKLLAIDHRTYLWVYLVFDYLDKVFDKGFEATDAGIDAVIQTVPAFVSQAYDKMLNRSQDDETVKAVKNVLSIILAARRPLTISEMNIAMALNDQSRGQSIYDLDLEQDEDFSSRLRTLCGLFVNIHHGRIYFFHQSAWEFLIQSSAPTTVSSDLQWYHSITTRHAHSVLAEICMKHLDMLNYTPTREFFHYHRQGSCRNALIQYSIEHMGYHFCKAEFEKSSVMVDLALKLCTPDLTSHSPWTSIISRRYHVRPESSRSILVSSHLRVTAVTELLLSKGADVEAKDSQGRTALMIVAESGHDAITQLLLKNGADVETRDDDGMTALMHAAESDQEVLTQLLLDNCSDIEARDSRGWTALMHAARSGHAAVTRLLSENGSGVEARDDDGWTALMHAARGGHGAVTRLLIESGADVKAKDSNGWTALTDAPKNTTQILRENGAELESDVEG